MKTDRESTLARSSIARSVGVLLVLAVFTVLPGAAGDVSSLTDAIAAAVTSIVENAALDPLASHGVTTRIRPPAPSSILIDSGDCSDGSPDSRQDDPIAEKAIPSHTMGRRIFSAQQ